MHYETEHPAGAAGRTNDLGGPSSEHQPLHSPGGETEGLIGAQDAGGAQGGAASHPLYVIHKLTPKAVQGVPQNKNCHCVGNPREENNQEIGQRQVCENHICASLFLAKQDWRDAVEEKDDITQSPNHHLEQKDSFQKHLPWVSLSISVNRHGEDVSVLKVKGSWAGDDISSRLTESTLGKNS